MLIEALQKQSGISESQLRHLALTASLRYKVYRIPKRTGGYRTIEHPSRQIKAMQRWLNKNLFQKLEVHADATAYKRGASIRSNAERHCQSLFTLRLDFENFFHSFSKNCVRAFVEEQSAARGLGLMPDDVEFVCNIVSRRDRLTIGAPSSPLLTNAIMFDFDLQLSEFAAERRLIYTRYADDLFISSLEPNALNGVADEVGRMAVGYPRVHLRINEQKTAYLSKRYRRSITGLVVTPDHRVSIGRDRKREIKALVHQFGSLEPESAHRLRGLIAFAMDAEPGFLGSLQRKYGNEVIDKILGKATEATK